MLRRHIPIANGEPGAAWRSVRRDADQHRSVNAGWPEAAFAGALGLRLAGPRQYHGALVEDAWMGDGRADATPEDIRRGLALFMRSCGALAVLAAVQAAKRKDHSVKAKPAIQWPED